jgi:hypothetical protein
LCIWFLFFFFFSFGWGKGAGWEEGQNLDLIWRILVVVIQSHQHHHPHHEYRDHHDIMLRNHKKIHIHHQEEVIEKKVRSVFSYTIILMIPSLPPKKNKNFLYQKGLKFILHH